MQPAPSSVTLWYYDLFK